MYYSETITHEQVQAIMEHYKNYALPTKNYYTLFHVKIKSANLTIYYTNKMVIQSNFEEEINAILTDISTYAPFAFKPLSSSQDELYKLDTRTIIGSDEVGTGDLFGGMVVTAAYVPAHRIDDLKRLGVKDSKMLSDPRIKTIGEDILAVPDVEFKTYILKPLKYNKLMDQFQNMNKIKALLHNEVQYQLFIKHPDVEACIIDGFCDKEKYDEYTQKVQHKMNMHLIDHGESKYTAIAAASCVARYHFLKYLDELSDLCNYTIPKGSGTMPNQAAKVLLAKYGEETMKSLLKENFSNYQEILKSFKSGEPMVNPNPKYIPS